MRVRNRAKDQARWEAENPSFDPLKLAKELAYAGFPPRRIRVWLHPADARSVIPGPYILVTAAFAPVDPCKRVGAEKIGERIGLIADGGGSSFGRKGKGKRMVHVESDVAWLLMPKSVLLKWRPKIKRKRSR